MNTLHGKNAVLTGASQGLGLYLGRALAQKGVNLALVARSREPLEKASQALAVYGIKSLAIPADITDSESRKSLFCQAETELGAIDILVNNAAIEDAAYFDSQSSERIIHTIETNLLAALLLAHLMLPSMLERKSGHIVNIASLAGKKGLPFNATYAASKAGLIEWTNAIQFELDEAGVGASVICPGFIADAGKFARDNLRTPKLINATTPDKVAQAVIQAIENRHREVIVSPGPIRFLLAINTLFPKIGNIFYRRIGLVDIFREVAEA